MGLHELADLLLERHTPEQVGHAFLQWLRRIFVRVFAPALVEVVPAVAVNGGVSHRSGG